MNLQLTYQCETLVNPYSIAHMYAPIMLINCTLAQHVNKVIFFHLGLSIVTHPSISHNVVLFRPPTEKKICLQH